MWVSVNGHRIEDRINQVLCSVTSVLGKVGWENVSVLENGSMNQLRTVIQGRLGYGKANCLVL